MKICLMQPYLFPYLGYFQLIRNCDIFVIHDDVQFIRQGWINRNQIILHHQKHLFVFSVKHDTHTKKINERFYSCKFEVEVQKFLKNVDQSYAKALNFVEVRDLIADIFKIPERNVSGFNIFSIKKICQYLGINTKFLISSEIPFEKSLKAEARVIEINKYLGSKHYVNPIGGMELYSKIKFREHGIQLSFLKPRLRPYNQSSLEFIPSLSIIDVLMNCSKKIILDMLGDFELL